MWGLVVHLSGLAAAALSEALWFLANFWLKLVDAVDVSFSVLANFLAIVTSAWIAMGLLIKKSSKNQLTF